MQTILNLCKCGKHGRFVIRGKCGIEFYSKDVAFNLAILATIRESENPPEERMSIEDAKKFYYDIRDSSLPEKICDATGGIVKIIDEWNEKRYDNQMQNKLDGPFQDITELIKQLGCG